MLFESFWSALGRDWRTPFLALAGLRKGRASLKQDLAEASDIEVVTLPFDQTVIDYIRAWRSKGGTTALVTASDQRFATMIARHLDLFDEAYGSDGKLNLKGDRKRSFLEGRFGAGGFAYMGDAASDLLVWQSASKAITVNASAKLRSEAERVCPDAEHLEAGAETPRAFVRALRPHQWVKNTLVFVPMLAAHQLDAPTFTMSMMAFLCFSLFASSVYLLNDLVDLSSDRVHPRKKFRPFAAGSASITHGTWMVIAILLLGVSLAAFIKLPFLLVMVGYAMMTTAYSLILKRIVVVDICILAGLYTCRILAGGFATGISLSVWLLAFSVFFFLSLAAVKRQGELVDSARRGVLSTTGRGYHVDDLPIISMIAIGAGYASVLVMILYVNSPAVMELYASPETLWGVSIALLYWITRTVMVAHRGRMHDDPVVFAMTDRVSQVTLLVIVGFVVAGALV